MPAWSTLTPARGGIASTLDLDDARDEDEALAQLSALLDLDAPAAEIADVLGRDPVLGFTPGLRVPGGRRLRDRRPRGPRRSRSRCTPARTHAGRLVAAAGEPLARPRGSITHLFPTPEAIAAAPDSAFAMPASRRETLRSLAGAPLDDLIVAAGDRPVDAGLRAMRALRDRDAWLPTDLGVRHALAARGHDGDAERVAPVPRLRRRAPLAKSQLAVWAGTIRMYGLGSSQPSGYFSFAARWTEPAMITSSPGCHWAGVATPWLAVSCSESITRRTSSKLRPVVIG